jgi:hypothetical protein
MTDKDELAALKKKVEELERKVSPPKSTFVPMTDAEHRDWAYQMQERRMSMATPPSVIRDFAVLDDRLVKEIALRDARAPTGPSSQGAIPSSQQLSNVHTGGSGLGRGWVDPRPLSNPPGTNWVDAQCIADEVRQRAELRRKLGK